MDIQSEEKDNLHKTTYLKHLFGPYIGQPSDVLALE